jgi:metallophosphoesterase superfamily enzyme
VLHAARAVGADVVLLAGDTFESHRLPQHVLDRTASVIAAAGLPVVLLPGNHDPAIPEAVFRRGMLAAVDNLMVLGVTHPEAVDLPHLELEIWGRAHLDYGDMVPLETVRPRRTRWQIAAAHGHYLADQ